MRLCRADPLIRSTKGRPSAGPWQARTQIAWFTSTYDAGSAFSKSCSHWSTSAVR
ncbi:hypothetical protein SGM_0414 [Streptomyces griseoaurantiacus M045]|uniref:Uncharacterized protein n=1 Tax=Streptomyces griseoaurantiacus M045 TaxID=996637 RepID=F3NAN0_9ACTN|nr:hypothetical protein SGM_0414 [Streptomyces griseoaurantiacus M045]